MARKKKSDAEIETADTIANASKKRTTKKAIAEKSMESVLWDSCNKLRGAVEPSEYKHVIFSLIFLKYANDKFDELREKMILEGKSAFLEIVPFYTKENIFFIPEIARWKYLMSQAKQEDIAIKIDTALHEIEKNNPALLGALPDNYYSRLQLEPGVLASLLDKMSNIDLKSEADKDVFGRIYEYFLLKFAIQEGKGKGEYYTPKTVVALLCELIEPYSGIVYDGACGSGGMFVQSMKFIEEHKGNRKEISVYGQESIATTRKLALMNLAIRGISSNLGEKATSTFTNDLHKDLKADYSLMNPPFNQHDWREKDELLMDSRWKGYEVPPVNNANYAWILNQISKLSQNGVGCLLLSNGALSANSVEYKIRKQLIENDLVEAILILPRDIFYTVDLSATVWIFNKNKKERIITKNNREIHYRDRSNEILFIDLRQKGHPFEKVYVELTPKDREEIVKTYHSWQYADSNKYTDVKSYCKSISIDTIRENNYSLLLSKYVEFERNTDSLDYDTEIKNLQIEIQDLLKEEEASRKDLLSVFDEIEYGSKL